MFIGIISSTILRELFRPMLELNDDKNPKLHACEESVFADGVLAYYVQWNIRFSMTTTTLHGSGQALLQKTLTTQLSVAVGDDSSYRHRCEYWAGTQ